MRYSFKCWVNRPMYGESKTILGPGFQLLEQWNLDSGFQSLVGFRILWAVFRYSPYLGRAKDEAHCGAYPSKQVLRALSIQPKIPENSVGTSNGTVNFGLVRPEYSGSALKVVHFDRSCYLGRSGRNILFHLTKSLFPVPLICKHKRRKNANNGLWIGITFSAPPPLSNVFVNIYNGTCKIWTSRFKLTRQLSGLGYRDISASLKLNL